MNKMYKSINGSIKEDELVKKVIENIINLSDLEEDYNDCYKPVIPKLIFDKKIFNMTI